MKVANIIEEGRLGGPQMRIIGVAKELKKESIYTTVVLPSVDSENFAQSLQKACIPYKTLKINRLSKRKVQVMKYLLTFIFETISITRYLKSQQFSIVHVSGGVWQIKSVVAARLSGAIVVWHFNDTSMPWAIRYIAEWLSRFCVDTFIVAGRSVLEYYSAQIGKGNKPVFEVQAPVNTKIFDPSVVQPAKKISETPGINIVTTANVTPVKGLDRLIDVAHYLNKKQIGKKINFWIVGTVFSNQKNYHHKLIEQIENYNLKNIFFYGSSDNIRGILKASDIYICSSVSEASPIAVWEAMSMELPVISTDVGDVSRFIESGRNGYVVSGANALKDMANYILKLIRDVDLRNRFGKISREIAIENLDISICGNLHAKIYKHIVSGTKLKKVNPD